MTVDQSETTAQRLAREWERERARVITFPKRHDIYMILSVRPACPQEISEELGIKLHTVMYHFRVLAGTQKGYTVPFIEMVGTDRRLGGIQHLWKAIALNLVDMEAAETQTLEERQETSAMILKRMYSDMTGAVAGGTMDAHTQRSLLRLHAEVDDEGMRAIAKATEDHVERIKEIAGESANRIAKGATGFAVATETLAFPVPGLYWNGI